MERETNILLTSVGRRSYLVEYFKEALDGKGKVHVANSDEKTPAFQIADYAVVTPMIYDESYIPFLIQYCEENKISAIISLFDIDLPILSKNKAKFSEIGTQVIVSDYDVINICNDKWETYCFLKEHNVKVPNTYISLDKAQKDISMGKLNFPVIIKPRWGMGSISIFEAENEEELSILYKKVEREIFRTYLKYESEVTKDECVLIQEKIVGQEYGLDIINDLNGIYRNTIVKMKYAMRSGETDCAKTIYDKELKNLGTKLSSIMNHIGNLDVDVFKVDEKLYVLEMNARFGGGYPFSHIAGVNLPKAIIGWLREEKVSASILEENYDIISQKDLVPRRLVDDFPIVVKKIESAKVVNESVIMLETELVPSLSERNIDISKYSEKLYANGENWGLTNRYGEIVGFLSAYINDIDFKTAYISFLAITPKYRGIRLGKRLLEAVELEAINKGMKKIKLEVRKLNNAAINLYQKNGYRITNELTTDVSSVYMEKIL